MKRLDSAISDLSCQQRKKRKEKKISKKKFLTEFSLGQRQSEDAAHVVECKTFIGAHIFQVFVARNPQYEIGFHMKVAYCFSFFWLGSCSAQNARLKSSLNNHAGLSRQRLEVLEARAGVAFDTLRYVPLGLAQHFFVL